VPSSVEQWRNARYLDDRTTDSGQQPEEINEAIRDQRTEGQKDRDRILYCSALRRLASVTQVTSPTPSGSTHNRLTHALKVAQVGRRISENLRRKQPHLDPSNISDRRLAVDPDVVEAAGLAHDLGHPPFGHISEEKLNELAKKEVRLIDEVFHLLARAGRAKGKKQSNPPVQIPANFIDLLKAAPDKAGKTRVVIDVLATMGEEQVASIHKASSEVAWTLA
jgi:dGTP triphosphohydrolase